MDAGIEFKIQYVLCCGVRYVLSVVRCLLSVACCLEIIPIIPIINYKIERAVQYGSGTLDPRSDRLIYKRDFEKLLQLNFFNSSHFVLVHLQYLTSSTSTLQRCRLINVIGPSPRSAQLSSDQASAMMDLKCYKLCIVASRKLCNDLTTMTEALHNEATT